MSKSSVSCYKHMFSVQKADNVASKYIETRDN